MKNFDLTLNSASPMYAGCTIERIGGRLTLVTPAEEAKELIGANAGKLVGETPAAERDECVLTGPMAVWSYLVVFHQVLHSFRKVWYDDGKGTVLLIAQH